MATERLCKSAYTTAMYLDIDDLLNLEHPCFCEYSNTALHKEVLNGFSSVYMYSLRDKNGDIMAKYWSSGQLYANNGPSYMCYYTVVLDHNRSLKALRWPYTMQHCYMQHIITRLSQGICQPCGNLATMYMCCMQQYCIIYGHLCFECNQELTPNFLVALL